MIFSLIIVPLLISIGFVVVNFFCFLIQKKEITKHNFMIVVKIWTVIVLPVFILGLELDAVNDCCTESAIFSPEHKIGIYVLIIFAMIAYGFSIFRNQLFSPILEIVLNLFLVLGFVINILLFYHMQTTSDGLIYSIVGIVPILMLFIIELSKNHFLLTSYIKENNIKPIGFFSKISYKILELAPIIKYPILTVLLIPVLVLLSAFLILFGQKPDSLIRVFTDTYKHGFSQLDFMCDNVDCGGHFLCSVGANGHKNVVKPIRYGERNGNKIICNRQLLISNAFEDLIQEKLPKSHKFIRKNYNKVGNVVHKYYNIFNIKIVSDIIYLLMKPLEWFFLLTLYVFDKKPENRIAMQYITKKERALILKSLNK